MKEEKSSKIDPPLQSSSFLGQDDSLKHKYKLYLMLLKVSLAITLVVLLLQLIFGVIYKDEYTRVKEEDSFRYVYQSPDGATIIILAGKGFVDSTLILLSPDRGATWEEKSTANINSLAINWDTGECIGLSTIREFDMHLLRDSVSNTQQQNQTFRSGDGVADKLKGRFQADARSYYSIIWRSNDYGISRTVIDLPESYFERVTIDWKTGNGIVEGPYQELYTTNFGKSWTDVPPRNLSSDFGLPKDTMLLTETGVKTFISYWENSGKVVGIQGTFSGHTVYLSDDTWNSYKKIYPILIAPARPGKHIISNWLALFSYAGIGLCILLFLKRQSLARKIRKGQQLSENSLAMMSDNPSADDKLGFDSTADAILKLLKNPDSKPPMTIAISGRWGSGKSSLMAQLQKKLSQDDRFVSMWFNVWHFQSENHMLAAFLASILQTFEQSFGFIFRLRLFCNKLFRLPFSNRVLFYTGILIVLPFIFYLLFNLWPFRIAQPMLRTFSIPDKIFSGIDSIIILLSGLFTNASPDEKSTTEYVIPIVSILTWVGGFLFLRKEWLPSGLSSFFQLIPFEKFKMEAVKEDPGFREKYKKEFWEILEAAGDDRRYVVFIDDMDRISGARLKELLEGINFISDTASRPSSLVHAKASIFFILGMSVDEVVQNLGKELMPGESADHQKKYGASFMQKLIDLVVQVPGIALCTQEQLKTIILREYESNKMGA